MKVPSIVSFVPYSTITIVGLVLAFKYDLAMEMIKMNAAYFNLPEQRFIVYLILIVIALMFTMQFGWFIYGLISNFIIDYFENIRLEKKERAALIVIFESLNGKSWLKNTNWCTSVPLCEWKGVKINPTTRRVNKLILADNEIKGIIPEVIGDLTHLIEIDMRRNDIKGPIPASVATLQHLEGLYLHDNYMTGSIPDAISELPALSGVYLFNNCFEGREASVELFKKNMDETSYIFI